MPSPADSIRLTSGVAVLLFAALTEGAGTPAGPVPAPVLRIQADHVTTRVNPAMYGLMTEEINYSYDGGLYAELVANRAFLDDATAPAHWALAAGSGSSATIALDPGQPLDARLPASLRLGIVSVPAGGRVGVANDGYWGIPVRAHSRYRASFYARAAAGFDGTLSVAIESLDTTAAPARAAVPHVTGDWRRYEVALETGEVATSARNRLVISADRPGTLWFSLVSLFPPTFHDRPNGNRVDLMRMLAGLHPGFLRFPGGNYLEGDTIATRFDWKATLGGLAGRPGHRGPWGYRSQDGMGLLEFLEWCEDLDMEPLLAVFAGYALKHEVVPAGPALEPFVRDALDEIEYVSGGAGTPWGARRARDGHPAPFALRYVEIGNEDWFDKTGGYDGRYAQFHDAIKAVHPDLQLIATARVASRAPDVLDEHFYRKAEQFYADIHHYDRYDRKGPKIFVGEWATREGAPTPNMNGALGDAAWMTAMERNADIVIMDAYAPLFVNVNPGGMQWPTDLIGYDALSSFGSPSYYAQQMYNVYRGDRGVAAELTGGEGLFTSVTRDSRTGLLVVKVVNSGGSPQDVRVEVAGVSAVEADGQAVMLSAAGPADTNTLAEPARIVPVTSALGGLGTGFTHRFPAWSVSVLLVRTR